MSPRPIWPWIAARIGRIEPGTRGILLVLSAGLCFSCMHATVRHVSQDVPPLEVAFFRNLFGLIVLAPWLARLGLRSLATKRFGTHALRAALQTGAMLVFFVGLSITPLANVAALSFTTPLFAAAGAVVILGERMGPRRLAALAVGFMGMLVILRPGVDVVELGALFVVGSSLVWAVALLVIKSLSRTEPTVTTTAYMALLMTPMSFIPSLFVWEWPTLGQLGWLALLGVFGTVGHYLLAAALKNADTSAIMPAEFVRLIWASALGFAVFGEVPSLWTWAGGLIIVASTTYLAFREARSARAERTKSVSTLAT